MPPPGIELFIDDLERQIYSEVVTVLQLKAPGYDKRQKVPVITREVVAKVPGASHTEAYKVMLHASKSPLSPIASAGRGKGSGYYYSDTKLEPEVVPPQNDTVTESPGKIYERHLWPLVAKWFEVVKNYKFSSSHIANNNRGGQWGNPDVVALNVIDRIGFFDIEIATAEVKLTDSNWRQWFFEAASHKRLSERSYFIFATFEEEYELEDDFFVYAEKFGVGIALIELDKNQQQALLNWNTLQPEEQLQMVDQVDEKIPASLTSLSIREKTNFLLQIGIKNRDEIYNWGKS